MSSLQAEVKMLNELVRAYYEIDSQIKDLQPQRELLNRSIKDTMEDLKLSVHVADNIVASFKKQSRSNLNKEKLLTKLQQCGFPEDFLADCWEAGEVQVLSVKKL